MLLYLNMIDNKLLDNITTLLGLVKKVYIRDDISTWNFCKEHNLKVYSFAKDLDNILIPIKENDRELNINNIKEKFSEKN